VVGHELVAARGAQRVGLGSFAQATVPHSKIVRHAEASARKIALNGGAKGKARTIEEALRLLGRRSGADRERELQ